MHDSHRRALPISGAVGALGGDVPWSGLASAMIKPGAHSTLTVVDAQNCFVGALATGFCVASSASSAPTSR